MVLAKSDDQGNTFEETLVIDPDGTGPVRAFDPQVWIDPDGQQTSDGTIYITYDFERARSQEILMTSFREDDINCGSDIRMMGVFQRRKVISKGGTD